MKNKLKFLVVSIFIFAMVFAFAACSTPVVGEWKTTTYTIQWMQGNDPYDAIADNVTLELTINNDKT